MKAAFAYVAVTLNLFGEDLYQRRGGRGKVKEGFEQKTNITCHHMSTLGVLGDAKCVWGASDLWGL